ncbi:RNA polymerase, sigma subunit, SigV [Anaerovirgula multivorans]|uniref:RNA polymerase, sigma subunit, SigV n=1 Tax=Anaerovirgula multivorans TaxID=312168 RepID=A0A239ICN9_9FIRM|nr:sigma-70 family RNA polymerase sigma factor [Anaerovirgula multivorans]SNS91341.1 RNA polymerase, sigma subunit, SigV [Anaerovirgula multivorans]
MLYKQEEQIEVIKEYIKSHQQDFYRLAYSYTKNSDDALDIVQEAIYKAIANARTLKNLAYLKTWVYRILVNESINWIRKRKNIVLDETVPNNLLYEDKDIAEEISIYNAIQQLEPKLRTVIILRFFEDMKLEEISIITKTNLNTVKSRLYKSLNILKNLIGSDELE